MQNFDKREDENSSDELNHRHRLRHDWDNLIEDIIGEGVNRGVFENLKGKGKPLDLSKNFFAKEQELAHSLLKENEVAPAWIMQRNDILAQQAKLRAEMARKWAGHERAFQVAADSEARGRLTISWDDACLEWLAQIEKLNQEIRNYNLKRPSDRLELFQVKLEKELERIGAPRWLR